MCGTDIELEGEEEEAKEEAEECEMGDRVRILPPPLVLSDAEVWGRRRGRLTCLAWGTGLFLWNVGVAIVCLLILGMVFGLVLLPTLLLLYVGFLCHSRVLHSSSSFCHYLDDNSCSALIILGFVVMSPLVVVAAASFCMLALKLRLLLLFQPMARARHAGAGWGRHVRAWV